MISRLLTELRFPRSPVALLIGLALSLVSLPGPAAADDAEPVIEEIVVTAEFRASSVNSPNASLPANVPWTQ